MKVTKRQLRRIIREEVATVDKEAIEDVVMDILSDEGGAAGLDPIEDALEDLEDEDISLPDEDIEDLIGSVSGVKRHADGDYIDTTQLESKMTKKYDNNPALKGDQDELPDNLQKAIISKSLDEDDTPHEPQYDAPQGSKRDKQLDQTKKDLKRAKELRKKGKSKQAKELEQRAYNRRDRMEKKEREKNESIRMTESDLREVIRNVLAEELSKKTKATLKKKAEKRGLTPGSVYAEFKKGLAAYASSGSRKGMSAHQWAHARVNSATPSKDWAVVKKSKAKKKKK
tara:strand:- start:173 stop:1027 length:855 start_codon:yes stop_codon:yes gene_type:complete